MYAAHASIHAPHRPHAANVPGSFGGTDRGHGDESDQLAASVMRSLTRSFRNQFSMNPVRAMALGAITFGLVPVFQLRRQFAGYIAYEAQQLWHLAEWLRTRSGGDEAAGLAEHARRMRHVDRSGGLWAVVTICVIAAFVLFVPPLGEFNGIGGMVDLTYRFLRSPRAWGSPTAAAQFVVWNVGLSLAFLAHWLRVRLHVAEMGELVDRFNAVARREGVAPIDRPTQGLGLEGAWLVGAAVLTMLGAVWAVPLALAGASQRRYINETAGRMRSQVLERMRLILLNRRPAVAVPNYLLHDRRCGNALCRALLRAGAAFCQRCGASAGGAAATTAASAASEVA